VISLSGIAVKTSIRVAGNTFTQAIIKYVRDNYSILIGEKMAEQIKIEVGSVFFDEDKEYEAKGRNLLTGLPTKKIITRREIYPCIIEVADQIVEQIPNILSQTPPELSSDIFDNGIILTGGGALLDGLDKYINEKTKTKCVIAEDPIGCVALGTGLAFDYLGKLVDGFVNPSTCQH
ncbi:MAG: rod shape-determining protein, partial [Oscillospiraceae bacterium]